MDKRDNRFRMSAHGISTSPLKTHHEMNGGGQDTSRKVRAKKKLRKNAAESSQKKEWFNEPGREFQPGGCWLPQGQQRLFAAVSDPAVCGYPVSLSYSIDQFSLPMIPVYPLAPKIPSYKPSMPVGRKQTCPRNRNQEHPSTDDFTSLPPGNLADFESDHQRRFSDPGLANGPLSDEESESGDESDNLSSNGSQIADRLSRVIKDNKRLETELQETKSQLLELKLEVAELKQAQSSYEPGVVCDLVREVRESMKLHQEAFLSRIQQPHSSTCTDKTMAKDCEDLKRKLQEVTSDRDALYERLTRLEEQVKTVMLHNSLQKSNHDELMELEKEKLQLRRELQEAIDARKAAENKIQNFEQLISVLQKKMPNGLVVEEKGRGEREHESERGGGSSSCSSIGGGVNHNNGAGIVNIGGGGGMLGGGPSSGSLSYHGKLIKKMSWMSDFGKI